MTGKDQQDLDDLKSQYKRFLDDKDHHLEDLEKELQKPNIFSILKIGRMEIRHSNFLGWLLDPNESHGLGNKFLVRILRDLALEGNNDLDIVDVSNLNFNNVDVYREYSISSKDNSKNKKSIDVLIIFREEKIVICIENKIDTTDFEKQLETYKDYIMDTFEDEDKVKYKKIFVYLTPKGDEPNYGKGSWRTYSYKDGIIEHLQHVHDTMRNSLVKTYISDYLSTLKNEIMGTNDEARELANAIYENHKKIIEFVVANRDTNKEYQQFWEKDYSWVFKFAQEFINLIEDADSINEYELGYVKNAITVKQKPEGQNRYYNIYLIYQGKNKGVNIDFAFSTKEVQGNIKESVKEILDNKKQVDYTDNPAYFTIYSVDKFKEELIEIHKKRFGLA